MKLNAVMTKWWKNFYGEIVAHPFFYAVLLFVVVLAFFVRVYRTEDLLGFYYDQGRDALVIWKLWHEGKLFLIGPVSGLAGIFLGPLYYYLIAPLYFVGGGDPRFPAIFLASLTVLALPILFLLGKRMNSKATGFFAVVIASFSYYLVLAGRWLSNPTPILLSSTLLLFSIYKVTEKKSRRDVWWLLVALLLGVSLQFESASAVFYLPMILVFALWQRKNLPSMKVLLFGSFIFLLTVAPQLLFNFRHENIIFKSFSRVLITEKSFRDPLNLENLTFKANYFWTVLNSKIFPSSGKYSLIFYSAVIIGLYKFFQRNRKDFFLLTIFLTVPIVCYFFFQGNEGHIYDYYMTGYYLPMVLLFSLGLGTIWANFFGRVLVIWFLATFLYINGNHIVDYLSSPVGGHVGITLGTEMAAVDWVYGNAARYEGFNVDVYVPPVIPHSYDYLFLWRGNKKCGPGLCGLRRDTNVPVVYTLFEDDVPHPERLVSWLERQKNIGRVEEQIRFGRVTVQRRVRI